jgi:hypothetical protein
MREREESAWDVPQQQVSGSEISRLLASGLSMINRLFAYILGNGAVFTNPL